MRRALRQVLTQRAGAPVLRPQLAVVVVREHHTQRWFGEQVGSCERVGAVIQTV